MIVIISCFPSMWVWLWLDDLALVVWLCCFCMFALAVEPLHVRLIVVFRGGVDVVNSCCLLFFISEMFAETSYTRRSTFSFSPLLHGLKEVAFHNQGTRYAPDVPLERHTNTHRPTCITFPRAVFRVSSSNFDSSPSRHGESFWSHCIVVRRKPSCREKNGALFCMTISVVAPQSPSP